MNKVLLLSLFLGTCFYGIAMAQETEKIAIENVVTILFDGMRTGDSSMVASTFHPEASMNTVYTNQEGKVIRNVGSLAGFLNVIGTPREEVLDEQILSFDIRIDGDLASVWTPYKFFVGETFSHCGVNSFQMARLEGEWKIIYIVDTRRKTDCIGD